MRVCIVPPYKYFYFKKSMLFDDFYLIVKVLSFRKYLSSEFRRYITFFCRKYLVKQYEIIILDKNKQNRLSTLLHEPRYRLFKPGLHTEVNTRMLFVHVKYPPENPSHHQPGEVQIQTEP